MTDSGYRLIVEGQHLKFEQVVDASLAKRIIELSLLPQSTVNPIIAPSAPTATPSDIRTYFDQFQPKRSPDKIATIAYYFKQTGLETFTSKEIGQAFQQAGEPTPKNLSRDLAWAVANKWLALTSGNTRSYYLTHYGQQAVESSFPTKVIASTSKRKQIKRG